MLKRYFSLYITISLLITSITLAIIPIAKAQTPTIFIDPDTVLGDLTPAPGTTTEWKINVTDIGAPGMIGHEFNIALNPQVFPDYEPVANGNFTTDASGWTPIVTGTTGTETHGYYATDGNPAPGSGSGSYMMRVNSTASAAGSRTFILEQPFTWTVGTPPEALVSYAYTISGNAFGTVSVGMRVLKPDGTTTTTLITTKTITGARPWSYNFSAAPVIAFNQKGTYKFQLRNVLTTVGAGVNNYVEIKWDDVGLIIAPISVSEGPFLTSDPRNAGKTMWNFKYMRYPTNNSLYVSDNLNGEPWTSVWPVTGGGMIANITLLVDYGAANLDLWGTILLEPGLQPPYTPTPIAHTAVDAYFRNSLTGDVNFDKTINIQDIVKVKFHWYPGPPVGAGGYNRDVDVNYDTAINIQDIVLVKANWGRSTP